MIKPITQTKGAALIMALLLVAIVSAISTAIIFGQAVDIQRITAKQDADQAYLDALFVPQWVKFRLNELSQQFKQEKKIPRWPQQLPSQTLADDSVLSATFSPATARFNINDLAEPVSQYLGIFSNLIQVVDPNINAAKAAAITQHIQQWLLPLSQVAQNNNPYAGMVPPYQAAHRLMISSSELRLVLGVDAELYRRLLPYIIALPEKNLPIDLNAATKPVLAALLGKNETAAATVIQYRAAHQGFLNKEQFFGLAVVKPFTQTGGKKNPLSTLVSAQLAHYYLIQTKIKRDKFIFHRVAILQFVEKTQTIGIIQTGQSL